MTAALIHAPRSDCKCLSGRTLGPLCSSRKPRGHIILKHFVVVQHGSAQATGACHLWFMPAELQTNRQSCARCLWAILWPDFCQQLRPMHQLQLTVDPVHALIETAVPGPKAQVNTAQIIQPELTCIVCAQRMRVRFSSNMCAASRYLVPAVPAVQVWTCRACK